MNIREYKTSDVYRASFYLMNGCRVTEVNFRKVAPNKIKKLGYRVVYIITFDHVDPDLRYLWSGGLAEGNLREYADARIKLKRLIRKYGRNRRPNR